MSLHPVLGHSEARDSLVSAHDRGLLPAALLFHGMPGIGKQRLALWLAQLLVCERPAKGPCGTCASCRMALSIEHPDVHWYFPVPRPKNASGDRLADALEEARLDELAEIRARPLRPSQSDDVRGLYLGTVRNIRSRANKRPVMARGQVFIVGEADLLVPQESSPEAANALLKLLEEPPGSARFILTSSQPGRLLPTIRSRTVPLHLTRLSNEEVESFLKQHAGVEPRVAARAAILGQGSIGRALGFSPEGEGGGPLDELRDGAFALVAAATAAKTSQGYQLALRYPPARARALVDVFAFVEEWLRDLAAVAAGAEDAVLNRDALQELKRCASRADVAAFDVARAFASVERARELAYANVNPQLIVSALVRDLRAILRRRGTEAVA